MSTSINTTQQQDRVAQKHLANTRQQAHAQGQLHGTNGSQAFAQLLSLACDEDTDLDASKLNSSGPAERATQDGDDEPESSGKARRSVGLGVSDATGDNPAPDTLHPTAQSNAVLLALLDRAAMGESADTSTLHGTAATLTANTTDNTTTALATKTAVPAEMLSEQQADLTGAHGTGAMASVPVDGTPSDARPDGLAPQPAPGKAVRDLARQLSAQRHNQEVAQTLAQTPAASQAGLEASPGLGVAWGRSASDAANAAAPSNGSVSAELASSPFSQGSQASPHSWHMSHAGQPGSRLHSNASATSPDATPEDFTAVAAERPIAASSTIANSGGQAQTGLGGEALGGTGHSETTQDALVNPGEQWQQQWSEAMEQVAQQVSYWAGSGGMRQATLRVGNGQLQAMDVKLSLKNGQADIEFRTNHEDARNAIAQGGAEVLRNLLASSGIDLASVSVGGQSAGADDQDSSSATPTPQASSLKGRGGQADSGSQALLPALNELRPRSASSVGLDVYV